jgi:hypothetical protein
VWIIVRALFNHLSGGFTDLNAHIRAAYHLITTLIDRFPALNVAYHQVFGGLPDLSPSTSSLFYMHLHSNSRISTDTRDVVIMEFRVGCFMRGLDP